MFKVILSNVASSRPVPDNIQFHKNYKNENHAIHPEQNRLLSPQGGPKHSRRTVKEPAGMSDPAGDRRLSTGGPF